MTERRLKPIESKSAREDTAVTMRSSRAIPEEAGENTPVEQPRRIRPARTRTARSARPEPSVPGTASAKDPAARNKPGWMHRISARLFGP